MVDGPPELSVVIPCRFEPTIGDTVRAVLAEAAAADVAAEVIVIGAADWQTLPDDPRVRVIEPERPLWSGPARNRGLAEARGRLVVLLDADCEPLPGWVAGIRTSQARPSIGCGAMVSPRDNFWQACYNLTCFREYLAGRPSGPRAFLPTFCLWGPRAAFEQVGGFDERWSGAEDLDLTIRLARAGWPLAFHADVRVLHRPAARSFWRIVRHGWAHGGTSIQARARYPEAFALSWATSSPVILTLLSPAAAAYYLLRTYLDQPDLRAVCRRGAPTIFLFRVAWCLGAAWRLLRPGTVFEPVANRST